MVQLEILRRTTVHATGAVAAIYCIDNFARNRRALRLIPKEFPRINKLRPDLLFQLTTALFFLEFRGYIGLFLSQAFLVLSFKQGLVFGAVFSGLLFLYILQIVLMLAFSPFFCLPGILAPELSGALFFRPFFLGFFLF